MAEVKKAKQTVSRLAIGSNNDAAQSNINIPRFELSSTEKIAIVVTTEAANQENDDDTEILANGLVAAIGSIAGRRQDVTSPANASRKRPRPSTQIATPQQVATPASMSLETTIPCSSDDNERIEAFVREEVDETLVENQSKDAEAEHQNTDQQQMSQIEITSFSNAEKSKGKMQTENTHPQPETSIAPSTGDGKTCNDNTTNPNGATEEQQSVKETLTTSTNTSPMNMDTNVSETLQDLQSHAAKEQPRVEKSGGQVSDSTPCKTNDKEENLSQGESEYGSQSFYLNGHSSAFAYTPLTASSQTSLKETQNEASDMEVNLPAPARLQDSPLREQSTEGPQQSECQLGPPNGHSSTSVRTSEGQCVKDSSIQNGVSPVASAESKDTSSIVQSQEQQRSPRISSTTNSTISSFSGMFQTAGSGASIAVSEEKVKAMGRMLDRPSPSKKEPMKQIKTTSAKPLAAMFQTAGSGSSIQVSEEKVKEMGRILNRPSNSNKASIGPLTASNKSGFTRMFQTAGSGSSIAVSEAEVKEMGRILNKPISSSKSSINTCKPASRKDFTGMFQTAGSGASIAVSEEKVKEMGRILNKPSLSNKRVTKPIIESNKTFTGMFQTAGSGSSIAVSEEKVKEMGRMLNKPSISSKAPIESFQKTNKNSFTGMFQTAGSGTSITVSEEKVKEMGRLLDRPSSSIEESKPSAATKTPFKTMFQTAGRGASIVVSEERVKEMGRILDRPSSSIEESEPTAATKTPFKAMFQTAGRGSSIVVSEEKVKEMGRILNRPSSSRELPQALKTTSTAKTPFKAMFQTAGRGSSIVVSEEKVKEMGRILDRPSSSKASVLPLGMTAVAKTPFTGMFQTAGSGSSISVSEEKVKEMEKILDRTTSTNKESVFPLKRTSPVLLDQTTTAKKPRRIDFAREGLIPTRTPMASFQTPRAVTIAKNESALSSSVFQTAGTGRTIEVSEEKIEEMGALLEKPPTFKQTSGEKNRDSQQVVKVTDLADKKHHQRHLRNPDDRFVEANLRLYPHSPLRSNGLKTTESITGPVACTPLQTDTFELNIPSDAPKVTGACDDASVIEQKESVEKSSHCQSLKDAIHQGIMSNCPSTCHIHGVRKVTLLVNCENALQLRFDFDGKPQIFDPGDGEVHCGKTFGSLSDIRKSLR